MSNRVEDLERQVAELQAAVNGLTEELVEMKERVRQVEDAQEVSVAADATGSAEQVQDGSADEASDASAGESKATGGERRTHSDDHVEVVERTGDGPAAGEAEATDGDADASEGDVIVPEQEATTPDAEAVEGSDVDGEGDGESDSDIIVA
ncbi:DUF7518 family protein [Halorubrum sp. N11]|uniref:DUF7518 family protein n=1 Tax=Halorubrum sp. N11 TaxID=3402276 RepID=UPI003EBC0131